MEYRIIILIVFFLVSCSNKSSEKVSGEGSPAEKIILKVAHND